MDTDELKFYSIIYSVVAVGFAILLMGRYIRHRTGQGLGGNFGFQQIPAHLRWMPIVAGVCGLYMLLYTILFLMQPEIQHAYFPITSLQDDRIAMIGIVLMPIGALIMIISQLQLGASYRLNIPQGETRLVTNGIYALSRNPLYMGLYLMFLAVWLMIPNWIYIFCLVFFVINYHFKITVLEEPYLQATFAEDYSAYCRKVNRYF